MIILLAILTRKWASEMQDPLKISWTNSNKRYQLLTCISDIWKVYQIPYSCIRNYSNKCTQKKKSMKLRISWGWKKAVQLSSKISTHLLFFSIICNSNKTGSIAYILHLLIQFSQSSSSLMLKEKGTTQLRAQRR